MDIQRYQHDHRQIIADIHALRTLAQAGVVGNTAQISKQITDMASHIKMHLAVEDRVLYPTLARLDDPVIGALAARFQAEMASLAEAFGEFVRQWRVPERIDADPEGFRRGANSVLKALYERLQKEDTEFFPAVAAVAVVAA